MMRRLSPLSRKLLWLFLVLILGLVIIKLLQGEEEIMVQDTAAPAWRGIIPVQTTQQEVLSILGQPNVSAKCPFWPDRYFMPTLEHLKDDIRKCLSVDWTYQYFQTPPDLPAGSLSHATHEIRIKSGRVKTIVEDRYAYSGFEQVY